MLVYTSNRKPRNTSNSEGDPFEDAMRTREREKGLQDKLHIETHLRTALSPCCSYFSTIRIGNYVYAAHVVVQIRNWSPGYECSRRKWGSKDGTLWLTHMQNTRQKRAGITARNRSISVGSTTSFLSFALKRVKLQPATVCTFEGMDHNE